MYITRTLNTNFAYNLICLLAFPILK